MVRNRFRSEIFKRPTKAGKPRYYVRFIAEDDTVICTKSLGPEVTTKGAAARERDHLLVSLRPELEKLYNAKVNGLSEEQAAQDEIRGQPFGQFVVNFWTQGKSDYLTSEADAGTPLAGVYIANNKRYAEKYVLPFPGFAKPLAGINLLLTERFVKHLKSLGLTGNQITPIVRAIRRPISWAIERNLVDEPFTMSGVKVPKTNFKERGILTAEQVRALLELPVVPLRIIQADGEPQVYVEKRPRLKDGKKNEGPGPLDIRMKTAVLLSFLTGMRRGEIRALRWANVNIKTRRIQVVENYVRLDGLKEPKKGSRRILGIPEPLVPILEEVKSQATEIGFGGPDDLVVFNAVPGRAVDPTTFRRGFGRALEHIGIDEAKRKELNLVLHSGRHFVANALDGSVGARVAMKITGHKTGTAFDGYADHENEEAIEAARKALDLRPHDAV